MKLKSVLATVLAGAITIGPGVFSGAFAQDLDSSSLVQSLESGEVFAPGTRVTARIGKSEVVISTYRNSNANDSDCKIEAVLAAKAVFDMKPENIARVTVYFFEPTLANFKKASVSLGDVKAFAAGEVSKADLIASIPLKSGEMDDVGKRVANYLEASRKSTGRRRIQTKIKGQDVEVLVHIDGWVPDSELKLDAIRLAREAMKAAKGYKRVYVTFADPVAETPDRSIQFEQSELLALSNRMKEITDSIALERGNSKWLPSERSSDDPADIAALRALPGVLHGKRKQLLERIKHLASIGVGVKPFLQVFFELEDTAASGDEEKAAKSIERLDLSLADQEKRHESAKNFKPKGEPENKAAPVEKNAKSGNGKPVVIGDSTSMDTPDMRAKILANPVGQVNYWKMRYKKGSHGPHDFPNYARLLKTVIKTLKEKNRPEAKQFEDELNEIKKKHPDWQF